jgi:acylphosphatase
MEDKILYRIHVKGRIQSVGFRWSAVREARWRGIKGFVKNQYDGSGYIEAEGPQEKLLDYLDWCRQGPGSAHVTSVAANPDEVENYNDFTIEF